MRKYFKILAILLVIAAIIGIAYFVFRKSPAVQDLVQSVFPPLGPTTEELLQEGGLAGGEGPKLQTVTDKPVFDFWIDQKTGESYYLNDLGQVLKKSGNLEEIVNSQPLNKLNSVSASFDGTYAVAKFNYPIFTTFSIFNTVTKNWEPLPINTLAADWAPNSLELVYADESSLNIFNLITQKTEKILDLNQKELNLDWISTSTVILSNPPTAEFASPIWSLDIKNKTLTPIIRDENGVFVNWSKDGEWGIKLSTQKRMARTSLIDKNGTEFATLAIVALPPKCLAEYDKLYCAIPKNVPAGASLPDDYFKKRIYFDDNLALVNLSTGQVSQLNTENENLIIDAEHLELHDGRLLFKNRIDGKLYGLQLSD